MRAEKESHYERNRADAMLCVHNKGIYNGCVEFFSKLGHRSVGAAAEFAREALGRDVTQKERRLIAKCLAAFNTTSKGSIRKSQDGDGTPKSVGAPEAIASAKAEIARLTEKNRALEEENADIRRRLDSMTMATREDLPTIVPTEPTVDIEEDTDYSDEQWNPYVAISDDCGIAEDVADYIRKKALEGAPPYFIRSASAFGDTSYFYFFAHLGFLGGKMSQRTAHIRPARTRDNDLYFRPI